jgi:hypothetical protein
MHVCVRLPSPIIRYAGDSVGSLPAVLSPSDALMTLPADGALRIHTSAGASGAASAPGIRIPAGASAPAGVYRGRSAVACFRFRIVACVSDPHAGDMQGSMLTHEADVGR